MNDKEMENYACFKIHEILKKNCSNKECRYWHESCLSNNCIINKSNGITHTLQEIGDLFEITRMRVCQIEKNAIKKIKKRV
tara:strand:- start:9572 stop:9814 length:243 start_codon:yes stop_codon:yes gene_type:complete